MRLRPDQEAVLQYQGGYLAVPAVPGAGKTTVLAALATRIIASGRHEPGRILIVTYTQAAVGNFRARIAQFLEEQGLPRGAGYEVRTLHSLAMAIVRERPDALYLTDNFAVADAPRQDRLLEAAVRRWLTWHRRAWEAVLRPDIPPYRHDDVLQRWERETVRLARDLIRQFKAHGLTPDQVAALARDLPPEASFLRWCADIYQDYQAALSAQGLLDFDDLVLGAYRLLAQDPDLCARLRERWTYLFEDEAQDSTPLQAQILELLAGPQGNLVRVGDPNQAILSTFTAADPSLFRRFCQRPDVAVQPLTCAGRSSPDIIDLANRLVDWAVHEHPEPACRAALVDQRIAPVPPGYPQQNPRPPRYTIAIRPYDTYADELAHTARQAVRVMQKYPDKTVAVLLPTNDMVGDLAEEVERLGATCIPLRRDQHREASRTVGDLLAVLDYLAAPADGARLAAALARLLGLASPDQAAFTPFLRTARLEEVIFPLDGTPPWSALAARVPEAAANPDLMYWLDRVRGWLLAAHTLPPDGLVLTVAQDMGLEGEDRAVAHHLALHLRRLLTEEPAAGLHEAAAWARLRADALARAAGAFYDRKGLVPQPGVVYAATCHSAKGLEWDTVFVACVTRDEFPSDLSDRFRSDLWFLQEDVMNPTAVALAELEEALAGAGSRDPIRRAKLDQMGERLRLLYVAITRARENLVISYHRRRRLASGKEKAVGPAAALLPLARLVEVRSRAGGAAAP